MTTPRILIIEDDRNHADDLEHRFEQLGLPVEVIYTEAQFRKRLQDPDVPRYSLAVVDMMLRWTDPAPDMELPPAEVIEQGSMTAGLRCCRALSARGVRCIIFTALSPSAVPRKTGDNFEIIHKSGDGYATLMERIRPGP